MTPHDDVSTRLAEIRERVEAATEGPWAWEPFGEKANNWTVGVAVYENGERHAGQLGHHDDAVPVQKVAQRHNAPGYKDAAFIAASRSDVPYLLSLVEEVGEALTWMSDMEFEAYLGQVEFVKGQGVADTVRALRDAAQEGAE